jgi:hypothetical protein
MMKVLAELSLVVCHLQFAKEEMDGKRWIVKLLC